MSKAAKRDRKRQNRQSGRAAQQAAVQRARRRRSGIRFGAVAVVIAIALAVIALSSSGGSNKKSAGPAAKPVAHFVTNCPSSVVPTPKQFSQAPQMGIDTSKHYKATIVTDQGTMVANLDAVGAPQTTNNFVFLACQGFYDGLTFHRVVANFVIQGGDPKGDGTGGPGYKFADELPTVPYEIGSLAMANSGPNTNGSQFFIVTGAQGTSLPKSYSKFGKISSGIDVAKKIEGFADPNSQRQAPIKPIHMVSVRITESGS